MSRLLLFLSVPFLLFDTANAAGWKVRIEEPTGLYRRAGEVVAVPVAALGGNREGYTVIDPGGRELPWQVFSESFYFPASAMPGELPEYRIECCDTAAARPFTSGIHVRRLGMKRVELGNGRFRAVIDLEAAAIVEAYNLGAGPQRIQNLVETTPENREALRNDIHGDNTPGRGGPRTIAGENTGWSSTGGSGPITSVEILSSGPLLGRVLLRRQQETWELTWTSTGGSLQWKASKGFRFAAVSAEPFLPFNRFVGGSEYEWPTGPGREEPPDHDIGPRDWKKLPGGHAVYYRHGEDYGALGVVALDPELDWRGIGSRRFVGEKASGETEIALTFPAWRGHETVLEARKEYRILRQPLLTRVSAGDSGPVPVRVPAPREERAEIREGNLSPTPFAEETLVLDGQWELGWAEKGAGPPSSGWRTVRVPGSAHIQWLEPEKVYSREAEWVSYKEWWYRRSFNVPAAFSGKRLRLQFEATDYYAETWINGTYAGRHEGYIDPYEYDVTDLLRKGAENQILVRTWTPVGYYWKHRQYTVKGSYGAVDQKPDDITPLGITRPVRIVASPGATIRSFAVDTRLVQKGAEVEIQVEADGDTSGLRWEVTLSPRNFTAPERLQLQTAARSGVHHLLLPVSNPRLWWTWDHGKPNLYTLDLRLLDDAGRAVDGKSIAVGIREIEKVGWKFYLNRRQFFVRGTNYYYNLFMSEMNRDRYGRDMELMLRMNVNMIRLHCHFTNPEFYDLADEMGVLLWQDYLEAWYPHDTGFSLRAAELYDNHIRYVRNHPSVALWATSDEEDLENYRDLTKHLAPRPALLDLQRRPVVRSTGRYGDAHVYHGWYDGSVWDYTTMSEEFVSELGATSLPNYETLVKFMGKYWPIRDHPSEWSWRRLQIPEAMRAWGDPGNSSMQEYVPRTQAYVARLFQIALERQRRRKAEGAGGILHFHAIDIWPSVTMAAIDIERLPTKVYDVVRRSFSPVVASIEYDRDSWRSGEAFLCGLWAINDLWEDIPSARVRWHIRDSAGREAASGSLEAAMTPDSARKVGEVRWTAAAPGNYELRAEVRDAKGAVISENVFEFQVVAANKERTPM